MKSPAERADSLAAYLEKYASRIGIDPRHFDATPAPTRFQCETCEDKGMVRYDVPDGHEMWGKMFPCPEQNCEASRQIKAARAANLLDHAGVPDEYSTLTFDSFWDLPYEQRKGKELAAAMMQTMSLNASANYFHNQREVVSTYFPERDGRKFSPESLNWIVLQGDYGLGKTGLAAALCNALIGFGRAPVYYRLMELFSDIQRRYNFDPDDPESKETAASVMSRMQEAEVLIIDEANIVQPTEDKRRIFEEILRWRGARELPTVLTCNASQDEFTAQWGERTSVIVFQRAHWIKMGGERLRRVSRVVESF